MDLSVRCSVAPSIMREKCKEIGVHFLDLRVDILDGRFVEKDEVLDKFARFFRAKGLC